MPTTNRSNADRFAVYSELSDIGIDHDAHVVERAALLRDRAEEALNASGLDPYEWEIADDVADCAANGLIVTPVEIASEMLVVADERADDRLSDPLDPEEREIAEVELHRIRRLMSALDDDAAGRKVSGHDRRHWLRVHCISNEGRCHGCEGGSAALCAACQKRVLEEQLRESVARNQNREAPAPIAPVVQAHRWERTPLNGFGRRRAAW